MSDTPGVSRSKISPERLSQIAARKLLALGVRSQLAQDGVTVTGELAFPTGVVVQPGQPDGTVKQARFTVVGHDHLRFSTAPLSALPPVQFYDLERLTQLEERLAQGVKARLAGLKAVGAQLQALKLPCRIDKDRLAVVALVKAATHTFELLGAPEGVRLTRVSPAHGPALEVSPRFPPLRLEQFSSSSDLELFLCDALPRLETQAPAAPAPAPAPARAELQAVAPPAQALSLTRLAQAFGAEAVIAQGSKLDVAYDFEVGGERFRFAASWETGSTFKGTVRGAAGEKWAGRFELDRFPGVRKLAASLFGAQAAAPASGAGAAPAEPSAPATAPGELAAPTPGGGLGPQAGEVWVMNVLIEREDQSEVRYSCVDVNGSAYGAARVLARADFESVFTKAGLNWRLLIVIDRVDGNQVTYRQLDASRNPRGAARTLDAGTLASNFVPEAAAY